MIVPYALIVREQEKHRRIKKADLIGQHIATEKGEMILLSAPFLAKCPGSAGYLTCEAVKTDARSNSAAVFTLSFLAKSGIVDGRITERADLYDAETAALLRIMRMVDEYGEIEHRDKRFCMMTGPYKPTGSSVYSDWGICLDEKSDKRTVWHFYWDAGEKDPHIGDPVRRDWTHPDRIAKDKCSVFLIKENRRVYR